MTEFDGTAEICKTGIQQPLTAAYEFWQIPADRQGHDVIAGTHCTLRIGTPNSPKTAK